MNCIKSLVGLAGVGFGLGSLLQSMAYSKNLISKYPACKQLFEIADSIEDAKAKGYIQDTKSIFVEAIGTQFGSKSWNFQFRECQNIATALNWQVDKILLVASSLLLFGSSAYLIYRCFRSCCSNIEGPPPAEYVSRNRRVYRREEILPQKPPTQEKLEEKHEEVANIELPPLPLPVKNPEPTYDELVQKEQEKISRRVAGNAGKSK